MDITYNPNKQMKKKVSWVYSKPIMPRLLISQFNASLVLLSLSIELVKEPFEVEVQCSNAEAPVPILSSCPPIASGIDLPPEGYGLAGGLMGVAWASPHWSKQSPPLLQIEKVV